MEHQKTKIKETMEQLQPWSPESYVTSRMYCHSSKFVLLHNINTIATAACGSLDEKFFPGDFAIPDQFIDRTMKRWSPLLLDVSWVVNT